MQAQGVLWHFGQSAGLPPLQAQGDWWHFEQAALSAVHMGQVEPVEAQDARAPMATAASRVRTDFMCSI